MLNADASALCPAPEIGRDTPSAVLHGRVFTHHAAMQLDELLLCRLAMARISIFIKRPRDLKLAPGIFAHHEVRCRAMTGVAKALQVVIGRVPATSSCKIIKTSPPGAALPDIQQTWLALGTETIQPSIRGISRWSRA